MGLESWRLEVIEHRAWYMFRRMSAQTRPPKGAVYIRLLLIAILTLGFMARAATYRSPLFDFHSWRQADTATIARNFAEERFNPLYPQVDWRGGQLYGFVETGFELHAFAVAALSKLFGFSPSLGRLLNASLFPFAALLLFRFVRFRYGDAAALAGAFIYSLGLPLTMFIDRAFMNESLLALLSIACLWAAQAYCARARVGDLAILLTASVLIAVVKPTYLIVWGPVAGLFLERFGMAALVRWELWLVCALTVASGTLWFWHARNISELTGLSFGLSDKLMNADVLLSPEYPFKVARRLVKDILGPVGAVFAPIGGVIALRRGKLAEALGILTFAVYLVVVAAGNFHHNYYQLPVVPIATVLASLGIVGTVTTLSGRYHWHWTKGLTVYSAILWVAAMSTLIRSVSAHNWYEQDRSRLRLCEDLKPQLADTDRLVFVNEQSPDMLFCLDRKGWLLNEDQSTVGYIRHLTQAGGSVVVLHKKDHQVSAQLEAVGQRLAETPDFLAFRMTPPPAVADR